MVFSDSEIEEEVSGRGVFDEEGEGGTGEVGEAFDFGLDEGCGGNTVDLRCSVYDADFYCRVGRGDFEVRWRLCHFGRCLEKMFGREKGSH